MASELNSLYLVHGDDEAKLAEAVSRLRERAEREQGQGALERVPARGNGAIDVEGIAASAASLSLTATHRYVLAEGADRAGAAEVKELAPLLTGLGDDLTLVLVGRGQVKAGLLKAVEAADGQILAYAAPKRRELPSWLAGEARRRGIEIVPAAAKALIDRVGERTTRLTSELDRLAIWAEPGERIGRDEIAASVADDSEEVIWTLSDAIIDRRPDLACRAAERLLSQGEAVPPIVYGTAKSLRRAVDAADRLQAGERPREVEKSLGIHPYAARKLVGRVAGTSPDELRDAIARFAELEWETRGGSDRDERAALVLAVREAAGG